MEIIDKERIRTINPNNTDYCFSAFLYAISTIAGEEGYKLYNSYEIIKIALTHIY